MLDENKTNFAAIGFEQAHRDGHDMAVIAVRATFVLHADGHLKLSDKQELVYVDQYIGDPHKTPMIKPADLVPYKPNTDITVLARSYPHPDNATSLSWKTGVKIDKHQYIVRLHRPFTWQFRQNTWQRSEPKAIEAAMVDYRIAASNLVYHKEPPQEAWSNPIGIKRLDIKTADQDKSYPSVVITGEHDELVSPDQVIGMHGFGPVPPQWKERVSFAGTYDEKWLEERHPQLPEDFDYRFYQCAHPSLIMDGYLNGGEAVELARVLPGGANIMFNVPDYRLVAHYHWNDQRCVKQRLNLDGVHIDLREEPYSVEVTWRGWLPICPDFFKIDLAFCDQDNASVTAVGSDGLLVGEAI